MDALKNFAKATVSLGYDAAATSIVLVAGGAARFPSTPFQAVWWNATDFPDPSDDPNVEIVRVTLIAGETLTITRAQEGTAASTKNTAGKTYQLIAPLTKNYLDDVTATIAALPQSAIQSMFVDGGDITAPHITFFDGSGVSWEQAGGDKLYARVRTDYQSSGDYLTTAMQSDAVTLSNVNVSAGTTSNNLSAITFDNSNGVSFGLDGSTITATVATNYQSAGAYLTTAALSGDTTKYAGVGETVGTVVGTDIAITMDTAGLSLVYPKAITTAALSNHSHGVSFTSGSVGFQTLSFTNSNGFSFNSGTQGVFGSYTVPSVTEFLTTAMQSQSSSVFAKTGFTTTTIAGAVVAGTHDTVGLKLAVPAYLTTAGLSGDTTNYAGVGETVGTIAGSDLALTVNTLGVSIGYAKWLTTAMLSNAATISNINVSAGTTSNNLSAVTFDNAGGVSFGLAGSVVTASAPGAAASPVNFSAGTTSSNLDSVVFSNSNGFSFGLNGSTITAAGPFVGYLEPYPQTNTSAWVPGAGSWYFAPFVAPGSMSGGRINLLMVNTSTAGICMEVTSVSFVTGTTGTKNQSATYSEIVALYQQGTGSNSTRLESFWSNSFSFGLSNVVNVSFSGAGSTILISNAWSISYISEIGSNGSYTLNQFNSAVSATGTGTRIDRSAVSAAASSIRNMLSNSVIFPVGLNTMMTAGNYWLAQMFSTTTASAVTNYGAASGLIFSNLNQVAIQRIDMNSLYRNWASTTTNARSQIFPGGGAVYTAASAVPPTFVNFSSDLATIANNLVPYFNFVFQGITK